MLILKISKFWDIEKQLLFYHKIQTEVSGHHVKLTHWFLDRNVGCGLYERSNADRILGSHSKEIGLSGGEVVSHGVLSASGVGERGPGLTITLTLLNDVVTDGRAAIILREEPVELAGVNRQVLSGKRNANRPRDV